MARGKTKVSDRVASCCCHRINQHETVPNLPSTHSPPGSFQSIKMHSRANEKPFPGYKTISLLMTGLGVVDIGAVIIGVGRACGRLGQLWTYRQTSEHLLCRPRATSEFSSSSSTFLHIGGSQISTPMISCGIYLAACQPSLNGIQVCYWEEVKLPVLDLRHLRMHSKFNL